MINPDEFTQLIDPQFQSKIAHAIADGLKEYLAEKQPSLNQNLPK
jgi:N-acetylmuramoyl-L-alanine amidase